MCVARSIDGGVVIDASSGADAAPDTDAPIESADADIPDATAADASTPDASIPDASIPDASSIDAGPVEITISQSVATTISAGNSVACVAQDPVTGEALHHREGGYYRVFDLSSYGIASDFVVTGVSVGVERAVAGAGGAQPANVKLYTLTGALTVANLTSIGTAATSVPDTTTGLLLDVPVTGSAPAGSVLVVEFQTPDGEPDGNLLIPGSNPSGQTNPTYLRAPDCTAPEPTDVATLGFPTMHWVLTVTGTHSP